MNPEVQKFIENNYLSIQEDEGLSALFLKPDPRIKNDKLLQLTPFLPSEHLESWIQNNTSRIINILQNKQADEIERQFALLFPHGSLTTELYRPATYYGFSVNDLEKFYDVNFGQGAFQKLTASDQLELKEVVREGLRGLDLEAVVQAGLRVVNDERQASVQDSDSFISVNTYDLIKAMGFKNWLEMSQDERQLLPKVLSNFLEVSIPVHRVMLAAFKKIQKGA